MSNALNQQKVFVGLGYAEIKKTALNQHQVIVDQVNTYAEAQEMMGRLNEQGHQVWINQCNCCRLTEEDHLQTGEPTLKLSGSKSPYPEQIKIKNILPYSV